MYSQGWPARFGPVVQIEREDWGLVRSLRVYYQDGLEVEFGLTTSEWVGTFWFPPGGAVEPSETLTQAARREVLEEVSLDLGGVDLGEVVLRRHARSPLTG